LTWIKAVHLPHAEVRKAAGEAIPKNFSCQKNDLLNASPILLQRKERAAVRVVLGL
jgi:hypothetical protein